MSGSSEALARLKQQATADYETLRTVVEGTGRALLELRACNDLVEGVRAADRFSLGCEAIKAAAAAQHEVVDRAIVDAMESTGSPPLDTEFHVLTTRRSAGSVEIIDPNAVPDAFMTTPAPRPDKARIRTALTSASGKNINWARLEPGALCLNRKSL